MLPGGFSLLPHARLLALRWCSEGTGRIFAMPCKPNHARVPARAERHQPTTEPVERRLKVRTRLPPCRTHPLAHTALRRAPSADNGATDNGATDNGAADNGATVQRTTVQRCNGATVQRITVQRTTVQRTTVQRTTVQRTTVRDANRNAARSRRRTPRCLSLNARAIAPRCARTCPRGIDRPTAGWTIEADASLARRTHARALSAPQRKVCVCICIHVCVCVCVCV